MVDQMFIPDTHNIGENTKSTGLTVNTTVEIECIFTLLPKMSPTIKVCQLEIETIEIISDYKIRVMGVSVV